MTAATALAASQHDDSPGRVFLVQPGWDCRPDVLAGEAAAIFAIGPVGLRRSRARGIPRRTARHWHTVSRLVQPLDAAREALHHDDDPDFLRAGAHAAAIVLQHCADTGRSYWAWTSWDWARLCGSSAAEFLAARTLPIERTVRPFLVAMGYLVGGFTGFHHLGNFNRLHLAGLVFGQEQVEESIAQAAGILDQWGYQDPLRVRHRLRGIFSQALLINHSPHLADLTTGAFAALAVHPASTGRYREMTYALQRACASLGYCDPPVRTGRNNAPGIDGTSPQWAACVERWHATSALSPRVRATVRTIMAKAGRWLADEHPEILEPGQWTRQICAAWVSAVDRMVVGDYVQRHDHIQARAGKPILPRSKAHILGATRTFFRDLQEWEWIGAGSTLPARWRCRAP
jgi:hypothetical protein